MNAFEIVFDWVLAASVRASVLAVAVVGIQIVFRRCLSAGWRHLMWLPMVVVLVLPVLPAAPFGVFPPDRESGTGFKVPFDATVEIAGAGPVSAVAVPSEAARRSVNVLAVVWFAGACGVLVTGLAGYFLTMRRVRRGMIAASAEVIESLDKAAREAGLSRAPRLTVSRAVESPAVTGLFRPVMLLPVGFPGGFDAAEARLILLHECSHLKRLDLPLNWLCCFLQAAHWFNPLLWFAFARMRADREAACDARVLSIHGTDCRAAYGGALLKLQGILPSKSLNLGFVGIFENASDVRSRIVGISEYRPVPAVGHAAGVVACAVLLLFGATRAEVAEGPQPVDEPQPAEGKAEVNQITAKLRSIRIPTISLEDATLEEAVGLIRSRSVELDVEEVEPAKKGVNFVIRKPRLKAGDKPAAPFGPITLHLEDVTLMQALLEVAKQSGTVFKVDQLAVTFVSQEEQAAAVPLVREPAAGAGVPAKLMEAANKIIIPSVDFADVTLREAVDFLNAQAKEIAKGEPAVLLVIDPEVDATVRIKELRLRNVPLAVAATYCAEGARLRLVGGENEIRFGKW